MFFYIERLVEYGKREVEVQSQLQISFRHMEHSDAIETKIRERAKKLDKFYDLIMSCRVVVEPAHKHKHKGNLYQVSIDVTVPGKELVVTREPDEHHAHEDVYVSIRDAFDAMRRQLEDYSRIQRGKVKTHEVPPHGRVSRLMPEENRGIISTPEGREVYFYRNSVANAKFTDLAIGDEVRFSEEQDEEGSHATAVFLK